MYEQQTHPHICVQLHQVFCIQARLLGPNPIPQETHRYKADLWSWVPIYNLYCQDQSSQAHAKNQHWVIYVSVDRYDSLCWYIRFVEQGIGLHQHYIDLARHVSGQLAKVMVPIKNPTLYSPLSM